MLVTELLPIFSSDSLAFDIDTLDYCSQVEVDGIFLVPRLFTDSKLASVIDQSFRELCAVDRDVLLLRNDSDWSGVARLYRYAAQYFIIHPDNWNPIFTSRRPSTAYRPPLPPPTMTTPLPSDFVPVEGLVAR